MKNQKIMSDFKYGCVCIYLKSQNEYLYTFTLCLKRMLFPIRCITCGKVIGQYHNQYLQMLEQGTSIKDALEKLKITRYCCKRMFMCHNDIFDYVSEFDKKDYPFIHDKFEKTILVNLNPEFNTNENTINSLPEEKGSDDDNSETDLIVEDTEDVDEDVNYDFED